MNLSKELRSHRQEKQIQPSPEYIAGFFDGEGCVMIIKAIRDRAPKLVYSVRVDLTQKKPGVLDRIRQFLGYGKVIRSNGFPIRPRPIAKLKIRKAENVAKFVALVLPHSIVKQRELVLVAEFLRKKDSLTLKQQEEFYQKVRRLKKDWTQ